MAKNLRVLIGIMMFVLAVSLCVSSNASAQGQGQTGPPENSSGGGPIFGNSWYDDGNGSISTEGEIQIGEGDVDCGDPNTAGTIRWTGTDFEGCNGTEWVSLTTPTPTHYAIGDTGPAGGIVFYITPGSNGQHGLEAAPADQSTGQYWDPTFSCGLPGGAAEGAAVGTGAQNTKEILAACSETATAAKIADAYTLNGYHHWFLPSKDELNLMYTNLHQSGKGGFANFNYWTSTQGPPDTRWFAFYQYFGTGFQAAAHKNSNHKIRAVRAF